MLTFLRKIRKSLIESGSTRKYLLYAIGEIALVVIGILIALQINNWNEQRIKDRSVKNHLESLAKAIDHDMRELSIAIEFNEFRYHSWQHIFLVVGVPFDALRDMKRPETFIEDLVWKGPYPNTLSKPFTDKVMRQIGNAFLGFVFNKSAIDEINNLGILSEMRDDSLKTMINQYYYHLDWKFGEQLINKRHQAAYDLKKYFRENFEISINFPPGPEKIINAVKQDEKLVILIKDLINEANEHYWYAYDLRQRAKDLVDKLRNYD